MGWEDPLEEGMATHSSILAWRITWTEEPGGLQSTDHRNPTLILGGGQRDALIDIISRTQAMKLVRNTAGHFITEFTLRPHSLRLLPAGRGGAIEQGHGCLVQGFYHR